MAYTIVDYEDNFDRGGQKEGSVCKLYSNTDVTKYKESDLDRIKSTSFEFTDHVEGKCLVTRKASDIMKFAKSILGKVQ